MVHPNGNGRSDPERHDFEREILALRPRLWRFCKFLVRDQEDADDLAQDTIVKAFRAWRSYVPGTDMKSWLFTIARNRLSSDRRRYRFRGEWDPEYAERTLTTDGEVSEAEASLNLDRLLLCLACVSRDQSDALIAIAYLGLSYEDVAERLGCPIGTIKSRVGRGRDELAAWFEGSERIPKVDISWFQNASQGVPASHPLFPIVKAYEELYTRFDVEVVSTQPAETDEEKAWNELVSSGALDFDEGDMESVMWRDA